MEIGQIKMSSCLLFSLRLGCFPWINALQIVEGLYLISRVLKKIDFNHFCQCSHCCYGEDFQRLLLYHTRSMTVRLTRSLFFPPSLCSPETSHQMKLQVFESDCHWEEKGLLHTGKKFSSQPLRRGGFEISLEPSGVRSSQNRWLRNKINDSNQIRLIDIPLKIWLR